MPSLMTTNDQRIPGANRLPISCFWNRDDSLLTRIVSTLTPPRKRTLTIYKIRLRSWVIASIQPACTEIPPLFGKACRPKKTQRHVSKTRRSSSAINTTQSPKKQTKKPGWLCNAFGRLRTTVVSLICLVHVLDTSKLVHCSTKACVHTCEPEYCAIGSTGLLNVPCIRQRKYIDRGCVKVKEKYSNTASSRYTHLVILILILGLPRTLNWN
jgi:hypothetical protein